MAVRSLLHYALEVPDQAVGQRYYRDFGLADDSRGDAAVRLRPTRQSRESVLLYEGPRKRLHHLCFGATGEDFARTREAIRRAGVTEVDPPKHAPEGGLWLRDPDGNLLNVREEAAPAPAPAEAPAAFNGPGYAPRQAVRGAPARDLAVAPRRLGHVLLFTPNIDRQVGFYSRVLGLKLSDRSQDIIAFLRCTTDHHNVALLKSSAPGFHHASFEVGGIDEIGMGAARMADRGWQPGWGFGRHVIGSNFFYYIRDPWQLLGVLLRHRPDPGELRLGAA
jgi:catechol 2,3-dioxygenase-like lactoylglutathione lyase family enzyme